MRKTLKFIHTVATAVLVGALLLQLLLAYRYGATLAAGDPIAVGARQMLAEAVHWLTAPSLAVVLVSGLLLMGMKTFNSAGWVWAKAMIGLLLAKGVLTLVDPAARNIAALLRQGDMPLDAAALGELARLERMEWGGVWVALALVAAAIAFGVWRPRFSAKGRMGDADLAAIEARADEAASPPRSPRGGLADASSGGGAR